MMPWPIFGVATDDRIDNRAHVFADDRATSMCGIPLRRMETAAETQGATCPACAVVVQEAIDA